jgi:hypothetical protein
MAQVPGLNARCPGWVLLLVHERDIQLAVARQHGIHPPEPRPRRSKTIARSDGCALCKPCRRNEATPLTLDHIFAAVGCRSLSARSWRKPPRPVPCPISPESGRSAARGDCWLGSVTIEEHVCFPWECGRRRRPFLPAKHRPRREQRIRRPGNI